MQKINEIAIVRHYKGKNRTILVGVYAKRKRAVSKALVEKYGFNLKGAENAPRAWASSNSVSYDSRSPISFLILAPATPGLFFFSPAIGRAFLFGPRKAQE